MPEERAATDWLTQVREAERRGELLVAVDLADRGLAEHPGDVALQHRDVLALARAGATDEAARRFAAFGLDAVETEDVAALGARIAKDRALALVGAEMRAAAATAARRYGVIYDRTGGYYPAINAATLWLLAGDAQRASALARETLDLVSDAGDYYALATEAEACLLLGDEARAAAAMARAALGHGGDHGALATTRRQLRMVCDLRGIDPVLLDVLAGPQVAHFCGHMIAPPGAQGRFGADRESAVAERIAAVVARERVGYAYGALASGADIMWAEALLDAGSELHVVLPFDRDEFVAASVAASGPDWVLRFEACLARANGVTYATEDAFLGDDSLFRYGTELAMGLALSRARYLEAEAVQFSVWDGQPPGGEAGTAIDVRAWRRGGHRSVVVPVGEQAVESTAVVPPSHDEAIPDGRRVVRGLIFGDVKSFSKLTDEQLPGFAEHVLGAFAAVIAQHADAVEHANTWGDALYVVVRDVDRAASCALALQRAMEDIDLEAVGLPPNLALRLGAHLGPVFPIHDPVIDLLAFMGSHVSRTARIEPVTPPGEVYVTDAFAAAVALAGLPDVACDYVGHLPAAKDFGSLRMHRLVHRGHVAAARAGS